MIEFTLSRVVMCVCGIALLAAVTGILGAVNDDSESGMMDGLADSVADILDRFEGSETDELTLRGTELLPSDDHVLTVSGHVVTITCGDRTSKAATSYGGAFELRRSTSVTLSKSVPEGLGDVPDGIGEHVDLLGRVVDVRGGAGAAVDPAGDVEGMGAVHAGADHGRRC